MKPSACWTTTGTQTISCWLIFRTNRPAPRRKGWLRCSGPTWRSKERSSTLRKQPTGFSGKYSSITYWAWRAAFKNTRLASRSYSDGGRRRGWSSRYRRWRSWRVTGMPSRASWNWSIPILKKLFSAGQAIIGQLDQEQIWRNKMGFNDKLQSILYYSYLKNVT